MDELKELLKTLLAKDCRATWAGVRLDRDGQWCVVTTFRGKVLSVPETFASDPVSAVQLAISRFDNRSRTDPYLFGGPFPRGGGPQRPPKFK